MRNLTCPDTAQSPVAEYVQSNALPGECTTAADLDACSHLFLPVLQPGPYNPSASLTNTVNPAAISVSLRLRTYI
jgi:hypothetical protein